MVGQERRSQHLNCDHAGPSASSSGKKTCLAVIFLLASFDNQTVKRLLNKTTRSSQRINQGRGLSVDRFADESYHTVNAPGKCSQGEIPQENRLIMIDGREGLLAARKLSGSLPSSAHCFNASGELNSSIAGPPIQCEIPGTRNSLAMERAFSRPPKAIANSSAVRRDDIESVVRSSIVLTSESGKSGSISAIAARTASRACRPSRAFGGV
jgi:hypothetical protein